MVAIVVSMILMTVALQSVGAGVLVKPYQSPIGRHAYIYPHSLHNNFHTPIHLIPHHSFQNFGASNLFNHKIVVRSADKQMEEDDSSSDNQDTLTPKEKSTVESQTSKEKSYTDSKPKVKAVQNGETLFESDKCLSGEKSGSARAKPEKQHSYSHHHSNQGPHYSNDYGYPMIMIPNFPPNQPLGQASSANIPPTPIQQSKYGPPTGPSQGPDPQQYTGHYIPPLGNAPLIRKPPSSHSHITPLYIYQYGVPAIPPQQTISPPPTQLSDQNLPLPVTSNPSLSYPSPPIHLVEIGLPEEPMMALSQPSGRNLTWDRKLLIGEQPPYPSFPEGQLFQYGVPSSLPPHTLSPVSQYYLENNLPYGQKPLVGYSSPYTNVPNYGLPVPPQQLMVPVTQNQAGQDTVGSQQNQMLIQTVKPVDSTRIGPGQIMNYAYQPLPQNPPVPGQENPQVKPYFVTPIRISTTPNDQTAPVTNQIPCPSLYHKPAGRNKMISILSPDKYMEAIDKHMHPYMFN